MVLNPREPWLGGPYRVTGGAAVFARGSQKASLCHSNYLALLFSSGSWPDPHRGGETILFCEGVSVYGVGKIESESSQRKRNLATRAAVWPPARPRGTTRRCPPDRPVFTGRSPPPTDGRHAIASGDSHRWRVVKRGHKVKNNK